MRAGPGESDPLRPITGNVSSLGGAGPCSVLACGEESTAPGKERIPPVYRGLRPRTQNGRDAVASDNVLLGSTSGQPLAAPLGPGRQLPVFVLLEFLFLPSSFVFYRVGQGSSSNFRRSSEARYGLLPTLIIRGLDLVYPSPSSEPYRSSSTNPACSYSACICRGVYSRIEEVFRGS